MSVDLLEYYCPFVWDYTLYLKHTLEGKWDVDWDFLFTSTGNSYYSTNSNDTKGRHEQSGLLFHSCFYFLLCSHWLISCSKTTLFYDYINLIMCSAIILPCIKLVALNITLLELVVTCRIGLKMKTTFYMRMFICSGTYNNYNVKLLISFQIGQFHLKISNFAFKSYFYISSFLWILL